MSRPIYPPIKPVGALLDLDDICLLEDMMAVTIGPPTLDELVEEAFKHMLTQEQPDEAKKRQEYPPKVDFSAIRCTCSIQDLMVSGCSCGYLAMEKKRKSG